MKLVLSLLLVSNLLADIKYDIYKLYQEKEYTQACDLGYNNLSKLKQSENFLSLYAFSCLNADNINRLSVPIAALKYSKEARANATYFSVIQMQKKLLYHSLVDGYDLSTLKLPTTEYVLSKVFDLYTKIEKKSSNQIYNLQDLNDPRQTYKLYLIKDVRLNKIVIEEFYDTIAIKRHLYW